MQGQLAGMQDCGCCKRHITHNWNSASNSTPSHSGVACKGRPRPCSATEIAKARPGSATLRSAQQAEKFQATGIHAHTYERTPACDLSDAVCSGVQQRSSQHPLSLPISVRTASRRSALLTRALQRHQRTHRIVEIVFFSLLRCRISASSARNRVTARAVRGPKLRSACSVLIALP